MPENFIESLYQNSEQSVLSHQITRFECVVHIYGREYCRTPNNRQIRGIHQIVLFVGVNSAKKKRDKLLKMFYSRYLIRKLKFTYRTKCFSRYLSVSRGKVLIAFNSLRIWTRLSSFSVKKKTKMITWFEINRLLSDFRAYLSHLVDAWQCHLVWAPFSIRERTVWVRRLLCERLRLWVTRISFLCVVSIHSSMKICSIAVKIDNQKWNL